MNLIAAPISAQDFAVLDAINRNAFPPEERMDTQRLCALHKTPDFDLVGFYEGQTLRGFAFLIVSDALGYLFYFAMSPASRGKGYGAAALRLLHAAYHELLVDLETQDAQAQNAVQRRVRRQFYLRNGFCPTGYGTMYRGVPLEVLATCSLELPRYRALLEKVTPPGEAATVFALS